MGKITLILCVLSALLLCAFAENQHRQQENFHYSSSSKKIVNGKVVDEDDKSGFHRKQTGNTGGNYDESENMDAEARRRMEEMMRLSRLGMSAGLGNMGTPTFMTNSASGSGHHTHSGALQSGSLLVDDCDVVGSASSHQNMNAASSSQFARTGTVIPVVQPVGHRSESSAHYSASSQSGGRYIAPAVLVPVGANHMAAVDATRYSDANRRVVYGPAVPVASTAQSSYSQAEQDRYAASQVRIGGFTSRPSTAYTVAYQQVPTASTQQQYSASQASAAQSSQYQAQAQRNYDSTHDERRGYGGSAYVVPAQSEVLRESESQRYGSRDYERTYQPTTTFRPSYNSKAQIDSHITNLDRTVENLQRGHTVDRNSIITPRPLVVDMDYDDDQQQIQQQSMSAAAGSSASAYSHQSSRDILRGGSNAQRIASGYASGASRDRQSGYSSSSAYRDGGMMQSASSTMEGRVLPAPHGYREVDRQNVDRSAYAASNRRGNAEELGQEASDLLGVAGAAKPGGSYRQESDDSTSYGYHHTGTFGAERNDGVRGTYAKDGSVAATSKKSEDMHEENGRVKFSAESSHSKHEEHSERRSYDFPAGTVANQVSQAEIDRMSPEQKRAYWQQFGRRFDDFASRLYTQNGY